MGGPDLPPPPRHQVVRRGLEAWQVALLGPALVALVGGCVALGWVLGRGG